MFSIQLKFFLVSVFSVLFVSFSYAGQTLDARSCTPIDVSAPLGNPRYQGNIGWCYANVAADLLTFRYQKELQGQKASSAFVAIVYNDYVRLRPNVGAGYVAPALIFSQFSGICPQEFQDAVLRDSPYKTLREQIDSLVRLKSDYDVWRLFHRKTAFRSDVLDKYRASKSRINQLTNLELMTILENSTRQNFPRKLSEKLCQPYMVSVKPDVEVRFHFRFLNILAHTFPKLLNRKEFSPLKIAGAEELIKELHQQLSENNMVGVGYNTSIFYDLTKANGDTGTGHDSSIVGRRWNEVENVCELKLRNSWGKDCSQYTNPDLKHKCDKETGYIWIADTLLQKTISDIVYYRK